MKAVRFIVLVLLGVGVALADSPVPTPVDQIPVPAPRVANPAAPAAPSVAAAPAILTSGKVAVLPFEAIGEVQNREWVGRAVQQNLLAEVARLSGWFPVSAAAPNGLIDTASARNAAKAAGADVVVFGSFELINDQIRFNGQVLAAKTDQSLAGLKIAGDFRDLFALEDQLASQLRHALSPTPAIAITPANGQPNQVFPAQAPNYTYNDNTYPDYSDNAYADNTDDTGFYPYGYYYYGPIGFHHRRDHHHDGSGGEPGSGNTGTPSGFGPGPANPPTGMPGNRLTFTHQVIPTPAGGYDPSFPLQHMAQPGYNPVTPPSAPMQVQPSPMQSSPMMIRESPVPAAPPAAMPVGR